MGHVHLKEEESGEDPVEKGTVKPVSQPSPDNIPAGKQPVPDITEKEQGIIKKVHIQSKILHQFVLRQLEGKN